MKLLSYVIAGLSLVVFSACSEVATAPDDIELSLGLMQNGVLNDTVTVSAGVPTDLSIAIVVANSGTKNFRYSGDMTTSFGAGASITTRKEFRGFEVRPLERKNIGTVDLFVVDRPSVGDSYKVEVRLDQAGVAGAATIIVR